MGSFLVLSALSLPLFSSLPLSSFSLERRSNGKFKLEPANKLDFDDPIGSFGLNKLPQLMRRDAAGEQLRKRMCS